MKILCLLFIPFFVYAADEQSKYDWNWLNNLIDENKITTIEELLPSLPEAIRKNYVMMFKSKSLQSADYQAPRVILHWDRAKRIMSFNSGPEYKGGNSIELIQFNVQQRKFEFHRLDFQKDKAPVRDNNIKVCQKCHREDLRPNWEHYSEWPGAYGSNADFYAGTEAEEIKKFIPNSKKHPRYKHLLNIEKMHPDEFKPAHNGEFLQQISALNYLRVNRLATSAPQFNKVKYALIGGILCDDFASFFPEKQKPPSDWQELGEFDFNFYNSKVRYVCEKFNISIDDWFTDVVNDPKTNMFTLPYSPAYILVGNLAFKDEELKPYIYFETDDYHDAENIRGYVNNCKGLALKSIEALSN